MVSAVIATLCLKQWAAFTFFAPVKNFVRLSLKTMFNVVVKNESWMNWDEAS